jgi:hypothetical protein
MQVGFILVVLFGFLEFVPGLPAADEFNRTILPVPEQPFKGKVGLRPADSVKDFTQEVKAPKDAPNILLILTDDVGFGASSTTNSPRRSSSSTARVG